MTKSTHPARGKWNRGVWIAVLFGVLVLMSYAYQSGAWAKEEQSAAAQGTTVPSISIVKSANPSTVKETGENVTFTVQVTNGNPYQVRVYELKDDVFGNLATICGIPWTLGRNGGTKSCNFTRFVAGDNSGPAHQNTVTAKLEIYEPAFPNPLATPNTQTSSATVNFANVLADIEATAVAEPANIFAPSGEVNYTFTVVNQEAEPLELTELTDQFLGNLDGVGTCLVPQSLGAAGSSTDAYSCTFSTLVSGNAGDQISREISGRAVDNEGSNNREARLAKVNILAVSSSLSITKSADPTSVPETGGNVDYIVTIRNVSSDIITIDSVIDDKFGDIALSCSPLISQPLAPNDSTTCSFVREVKGDFGASHVSTTTVEATDNANRALIGGASASVSFTNVASAITVTKQADRASASRAGETVGFTVTVTNKSTVDVITLNSMNDSIYGDVTTSANPLVDQTNCTLPSTLQPQGAYTCRFVAQITGDIGELHTNRVTVTGVDDDQATVQAFGEASVLIVDPNIVAIKSAALKTDADNDGVPSPGDTLHYHLALTNDGNKTATAVVVNDNISEHTTLVSGSVATSQGTFTAGSRTLVVNLGNIAAGESATIDFDVKILSPLSKGVNAISNQATILGQNFAALVSQSPDGGGPTVTRLTLTPDLTAEKTAELVEDLDNNGIASPGDLIEYTIVVNNRGSAAATEVVWTDAPDPNTTVEQVTNTNQQTPGFLLNNEGAFVLSLGTIARSGRVTTTFGARVNNPLDAGVTEIVNQAVITSKELPPVLSDDPATDTEGDPTILSLSAAPVLAATEVDALLQDNDNNGSPSAGDVVLIKAQIINSGNSHATSVRFRNPLPQYTKLAPNSVNTEQGDVISGNSADDTEVVVDIGTLEGDRTSVTISFQLIINAPLPTDVFEIVSQGRISADGLDDVLTDDPDITGIDDPTLIQVVARPLVQATKTDLLFIDADEDGRVSVGDTLLYRISAVNVGNLEATGVVIEDTPDSHTTLIANSVQTAQGVVPTGNSTGDNQVVIDVGTLPSKGGNVVVSFMVTVNSTTNISHLVNQAHVKIDDPNEPGVQFALDTDDPDTDAKADTTRTPVRTTPPNFYLPIVAR
ncbi:MAG: hypothetical protein R3A44_20100 [Caldilineaceae bacterium]